MGIRSFLAELYYQMEPTELTNNMKLKTANFTIGQIKTSRLKMVEKAAFYHKFSCNSKHGFVLRKSATVAQKSLSDLFISITFFVTKFLFHMQPVAVLVDVGPITIRSTFANFPYLTMFSPAFFLNFITFILNSYLKFTKRYFLML